ncbi:MAG: M1 family aminopeptidase [bacterium]
MQKLINILVLYLVINNIVIANDTVNSRYMDLFRELSELCTDSANIYQIKDLFLEKEGSAFMFEEGEFYFFKPINNLVRVAVFIGDGVFTFTPPLEIEQKQLESYTGNTIFDHEFNSLLIFFSDSTYEYIKKNFNKIKGEKNKNAEELYKLSMKYICDTTLNVISNTISSSFLNKENNKMFIAQLNDDFMFATETFYYIVDPLQKEEIRFYKAKWIDKEKYDFDLITCYDWPDDYPENKDDLKKKIDITGYVINCLISDTFSMNFENQMQFIIKSENLGWLPFEIDRNITVDSILDEAGSKLEFYKHDFDNYLLVNLGQMKTDLTSIKFYYKTITSFNINLNLSHGSLSVAITSLNKKIIYDEFYPRYIFLDSSNFDITFHYPEKFKLCSTGEKISEEIIDSTIISRWITKKKISMPIFCVGLFSERVIEGDSITPKIIFHYKNHYFIDSLYYYIKSSYNYYCNVFGKRSQNILYVVEIPGDLSLAFDGIIAISDFYMNDTTKGVFNESACTHEIAHQWWAIDLGIKSYREKWLVEGLSEYSRLLYEKNYLNDEKIFFDYLYQSRNLLINYNNGSTKFAGDPPKPICLGYRSKNVFGDYSYYLNIYLRGAWIFHMLNSFITNFESYNDSLFIEIAKDFYQTFKGKDITIYDFIYIVNKHTSSDLSWFFRQWVDFNEIPYYIFGYKTDKTYDGKFKVRCRIRQLFVPDDFKVSIPIVIYYENNKYQYMRINVVEPYSEFEFPLLSLEPKDIKLNIFQSILCQIETDNFKRINKHTRKSILK